MFQAVRALMIVGIVLGILGLLVCIFALKCVRIGSMEDSAKANMTLTSGIMFIIAGKCVVSCLSPQLPGIEDWASSLHALLVIGSRSSGATQCFAACMKWLMFVFQPALQGTSDFDLCLVKKKPKFVWDRTWKAEKTAHR